MENASKALIMAASVLVAVMVITVGVVIFSIFGKYSAEAQAELAAIADNEFNAKFLKYITYVSGDMTNEELEADRVLLTAHDVVTIAGYARESNEKLGFYDPANGYTEEDWKSDATQYVQVDIKDKQGNNIIYEHFENYNLSKYIEFIDNNSIIHTRDEVTNEIIDANTKYYVCNIDNVRISLDTKRIKYIDIRPIN